MMPLLYDPRVNRRIITNNDALIMANIMVKSNLVVKDKQFWNKIKNLLIMQIPIMEKEKKRKIWFDPEYRKIKRHKLFFHCPLFNTTLSGCDMVCNPCLALRYRNNTKIVNIKDEEFDVYIGRGTKWGNKFVEGVDGTRKEVIKLFKENFENSPWLHSAVIRELQGKVLGCHCKPLPCHGDVLVAFIEGRLINGK